MILQGATALGHNPQFRNLVLAECPEITDLGIEVRQLYITTLLTGVSSYPFTVAPRKCLLISLNWNYWIYLIVSK